MTRGSMELVIGNIAVVRSYNTTPCLEEQVILYDALPFYCGYPKSKS